MSWTEFVRLLALANPAITGRELIDINKQLNSAKPGELVSITTAGTSFDIRKGGHRGAEEN